jgi:hypothetical protein
MTRKQALQMLIRVWGNGENMTASDYRDVEAAALPLAEGEHTETPIETLHRVARIPRPDPEAFPPYAARTYTWYRGLSYFLAVEDIAQAKGGAA